MKRIFYLLICFIVSCNLTFYVYADPTTGNIQSQENQVKAGEDQTQSSLDETKSEELQVEQDIHDLDDQIAGESAKLTDIEKQLDSTQAQLNQTQIDLDNAKSQLQTEQAEFVSRARSMYMYGAKGYMSIILSADSFSDLLNRIEYTSKIIEYDKNLSNQLSETEKTIQDKYNDLSAQQTQLQELKTQETDSIAALQGKIDQKNTVLDNLKSNEALYNQVLADYQSQMDDLNTELKAESQDSYTAPDGSSASYSGGQLGWPVQGTGPSDITSDFGDRENPTGSGDQYHKGVDIAAPYGTPIVAAESGHVDYADWMNGYGYIVIINHGGGLSTRYGHCSKLLVSQGDYVNKGDVIALVGSTGDSTGNHCHFEVRENGTPVDPKPYLGM